MKTLVGDPVAIIGRRGSRLLVVANGAQRWVEASELRETEGEG